MGDCEGRYGDAERHEEESDKAHGTDSARPDRGTLGDWEACGQHRLDGYPRHSGVCHAESVAGRRDSGASCALANEGLDVSDGRRGVTGSRRQPRRGGASVTVAVPPMRCTRAGPLVRGRLGVLAERPGSTCDASVSAIGPCSQRRRLDWMWRYPLVKKGPGPSIPLDEPVADRAEEWSSVERRCRLGRSRCGCVATVSQCDPSGSRSRYWNARRIAEEPLRRNVKVDRARGGVAGVVAATASSGSRSVGERRRLCSAPGRFTMMCGGRGDFCGWRPDALSPLSVRSGDPDRSRPQVLKGGSGVAPRRTRAVLCARKLTAPTRLRAFPERAARGAAPSPVAVV